MMNKIDFWWFSPDEAKKYKFTLVGHGEPYSDNANSGRTPLSVDWYHSIDKGGRPARKEERYPLTCLNKWRKIFDNINVFRSHALFDTKENGHELLGPFMIDIDCEKEVENSYVQDINLALEVTREVVRYLERCYQVNQLHIRVLFTGHKGFNVEIRPQAVGITSIHNRKAVFEAKFKEISRALGKINGHCVIEEPHDYVRLHNSINKWIGSDGQEVARMKYKLSLKELFKLTADDICKRGEELAKNSMSSNFAA
jgi:hypothetical protein